VGQATVVRTSPKVKTLLYMQHCPSCSGSHSIPKQNKSRKGEVLWKGAAILAYPGSEQKTIKTKSLKGRI